MPKGFYKRIKPVSQETRLKMSLKRRGTNNPNYGKINTPEMKEKQRLAQLGSKGHAYGKHPSPETLKKRSDSMIGKNVGNNKGDKHWNWKGGKSSEIKLLRDSNDYRIWRRAVFERDNYTCQECGQWGGKLEAHHIKSFTWFPELRLAIDNGVTLCKACHKKTSTYLVKARYFKPELLTLNQTL